jgi:hypothetical protein
MSDLSPKWIARRTLAVGEFQIQIGSQVARCLEFYCRSSEPMVKGRPPCSIAGPAALMARLAVRQLPRWTFVSFC